MSLLEIILTAISLAMDAFAVAVAAGIAVRRPGFAKSLLPPLFFGFFQAAMPISGWLAGGLFRNIVATAAPWIAFALLALIGGKMIHEACGKGSNEKASHAFQSLWALFILAIATSIDAFAVGVSFSMIEVPVALAVLLIGVITFFISWAGIWIGSVFGHFFEKKFEIAGGIILIILGIKIVLENFFGIHII
jgi:manganese efflux pump family protein